MVMVSRSTLESAKLTFAMAGMVCLVSGGGPVVAAEVEVGAEVEAEVEAEVSALVLEGVRW